MRMLCGRGVRRRVSAACWLGSALLASAVDAGAAILDFDFARAGSGANPLSASVLVGGVRADGFVFDSGTYTPAALWQRNEKNDHGLGICSEGAKRCRKGKGDVNELSNQVNLEVLRLTRPDGMRWTGLWISSLDAGGSGGSERGTLYWADVAQPDLAALSGFTFQFGDFHAAVEGDLFALPGLVAAGFDAGAKYLFFRAGPNAAGTNNDYLVWGGTLAPIPEPSGFALLLIGLAVLAIVRKRAVTAKAQAIFTTGGWPRQDHR